MKNYRITVNGVAYEVSVEELGQTAEPVQAAAPVPVAKAPAPAPKAPAQKAGGAEGKIKINAPMPVKILEIKVKEGDSVHKGDSVVVLEAMKMENEIFAAEDGVIAGIEVSVGDMVEGGAVLITMN